MIGRCGGTTAAHDMATMSNVPLKGGTMYCPQCATPLAAPTARCPTCNLDVQAIAQMLFPQAISRTPESSPRPADGMAKMWQHQRHALGLLLVLCSLLVGCFIPTCIVFQRLGPPTFSMRKNPLPVCCCCLAVCLFWPPKGVFSPLGQTPIRMTQRPRIAQSSRTIRPRSSSTI